MIRKIFEKLALKALPKIVARLPQRTIETAGQGPYLTRWYLWPPRPRKKDEHDGFAVFLHFFWRGDGDRDLHNHPWSTSVSLLLAGGYREERFGPDGTVVSRVKRPGDVNVIKGDDFHRVDLLDPEHGCWSIFVAGPRAQDWGFKSRVTKAFVRWQDYVDAGN